MKSVQFSAGIALTIAVPSSSVVHAQCDSFTFTHASPAVDDWLGIGVGIDGSTVVAGATGDDTGATSAGGARVFRWGPFGWQMTATLHAPDAAYNDVVGYDVEISGDTIFLGSPYDDDHGNRSGSVSVFERVNGEWAFLQKLTSLDAFAEDVFGAGVDIAGTRAVIGAHRNDDGFFDGSGPTYLSSSGSAYVFERGTSGWSQVQKLLPSIPEPMGNFGIDVAVDGDVIGISALVTSPFEPTHGRVHVFELGPNGWEQVALLEPDDIGIHNYFGWAIDVSGDLLIAGAGSDDDNGQNAGAAYVYQRGPAGWHLEAKLLASDGEAGDEFGDHVALDGSVAVVGAKFADSQRGAAYVFERVGTTWIEHRKFVPQNALAGDRVGHRVAISGTRLVAGAPLASLNVEEGGAVHAMEHSFGIAYCAGMPNSTGGTARISPLTTGCGSVVGNQFRLQAAPVPDQPGLFFYGTQTSKTPFANGFRCVAGSLHRLPIEQATGGVLTHDLDFTTPLSAAGQITAGTTWHFQAWFRDTAAGGAAANTSEALTATFRP